MRAAASRTFWTAGSSRPMRMAMIAITTSSSISVKARRTGAAVMEASADAGSDDERTSSVIPRPPLAGQRRPWLHPGAGPTFADPPRRGRVQYRVARRGAPPRCPARDRHQVRGAFPAMSLLAAFLGAALLPAAAPDEVRPKPF